MTTVLWVILGVLAFYGCLRAILAVLERLAKIETRLDTIENRDAEFDDRVLKLVPPPVERVYELDIYLDKRFWLRTLRATPEEIKYLESQEAFVTNVLDDKNGFPYAHLHLRLEVWRGGLRRIWFSQFSNSSESRVQEFRLYLTEPILSTYDGTLFLWKRQLSASSPELLDAPTVELRLDWTFLRLSLLALHGRFDCVSGWGAEPDNPTENHVYLKLNLDNDLSKYRRPDESRKETSMPGLPYRAKPWVTCYEHIDDIRGLRWQLWVQEPEKYRL